MECSVLLLLRGLWVGQGLGANTLFGVLTRTRRAVMPEAAAEASQSMTLLVAINLHGRAVNGGWLRHCESAAALTVAQLAAVPGVVILLAGLLLPDSPASYAERGMLDKAKAARAPARMPVLQHVTPVQTTSAHSRTWPASVVA